jgi:N-glycosylase/DNA lyase
MINGEMRLGKSAAAVLANALISFEDAMAGEPHFMSHETVEYLQENDLRDANAHPGCVDVSPAVSVLGELAPVREVVERKI